MRSRIKSLVLSGWVLFGLVGSSWVLSSAHASVTCANPNQTPPYNVSSSSANNVPVNQCYLNTVGECLYNTAIPGSSPSWNTGCPASVAGNDCCRWKGAGSASPTPRPTETPRPSPFPSGACCKAKPNANPGYDCSLPLLNFGHPQGISFAYQRCVQVNGGASCMWSNQNKECCAPGIPGCSSPTPSPTPECRPPNAWIAYPFQSLLPSNPQEYERCKKEAGATSSPERYRCCAKATQPSPTPRPTETPRPSPFPSGACCKAKPNANPGYDCSLPLLNFGHPQGISFAYQRCVQVNGGASCMWSNQNKECCAPGIPGCSSPTPSPTPACSPPQVGIPFPFSALATQPELAEEYANCKKAAGSNSAYVCCVDPVLSCKRKGGVMINGSSCPRPMSPIFGPVQGKICCKSR